jgi:hypothetical protein
MVQAQSRERQEGYPLQDPREIYLVDLTAQPNLKINRENWISFFLIHLDLLPLTNGMESPAELLMC